ncbi:hypothetical protein ACWC9T_07065 [Kitasatospora sp. NPDC001159]
MRGLAARWARLLANRWAGRLHGPWLLPGVLIVAVSAAGFVGYRDWQGHRPAEAPGRSAHLCRLPTGADTPLGQLLPPGAQDAEERTQADFARDGRRTCSIRVDGRKVLTITADLRDGQLALTSANAKRPDAHPLDVPGLSVAWPGGSAAARTCMTGRSGYVELEVDAGEAARADGGDGQAALERLARAALVTMAKELCQ